jgi:hypothetical protein
VRATRTGTALPCPYGRERDDADEWGGLVYAAASRLKRRKCDGGDDGTRRLRPRRFRQGRAGDDAECERAEGDAGRGVDWI